VLAVQLLKLAEKTSCQTLKGRTVEDVPKHQQLNALIQILFSMQKA
jgi:hypothetical protein